VDARHEDGIVEADYLGRGPWSSREVEQEFRNPSMLLLTCDFYFGMRALISDSTIIPYIL
jgi:hypothetical protein